MSLKGNLQSVDLANVLQMLSLNQREGSLVLFDGDTRKSIYFSREGVSMLSRGRKGQDSLGRILLRYGVITPEQLQEALGRQQAEGKRLGEVLRDMGAATDGDVENAVRTQIEEEIYNLFIWKEASFEFIEGPPPEMQNVPALVTFNVNSLIMEAQRRADEWNYIRGLVPSLDEIYKPTDRLAEAQVTDEVFHLPFAPRILDALHQGRQNVHEIVESSCAAKFEACKILAILLEQGCIEPVSIADLQNLAQEATGAGDHAQAAKFLSRIVDLGGATPPVNMQLGYALEALDEPERASIFLKAAAEAYVEAVEPAHAFEAYVRVARALPTDLSAVTQMVEIACNNEAVLNAHRHDIVEAGRTLAQCLKELGRLPAALQVLHKLCQAAPQDLPLRNMLVQAYQESGMSAEALSELEAMAAITDSQKNVDETIRILRRITAIDRNRPGAAKRIEALTRQRDRGKRLLLRAGAFVGVLALMGGLAYGVWWYIENQKAHKAHIDHRVSSTLDPLRAEFDAAERAFGDARQQVAAWRESAPASLEKDVEGLGAAIATMEDLAGKTERGAQALLAEFPGGYPPDTLVDARLKPLKAGIATARTAREELLKEVRRQVEDRYLESRKRAKERPTSQILEIDRSLQTLRALGVEAPRVRFEDREEAVAEVLETLQRYDTQIYGEQQRTMDSLYESGRGDEARRFGVELLTRFPAVVEFREKIRFQVRVTTVPEGATVRAMDPPESGPGGPSPRLLPYVAARGLVFEVSAPGFKTRTLAIPKVDAVSEDGLREALPPAMKVVLLKDPVWSLELGTGVADAPPATTPDGRRAVLADRAGWLHLVDLETGRETGRYDSRSASGFQASPVIAGDTVYAVSVDGVALALALSDLSERWRREPGGGAWQVYGSPVLAGEFLVAAGAGGQVRAWDAATGAVRWEKTLPSGTRRGLVHARGWVVVFCEDGRARTIPTGAGEVIEVLPTDREVPGLPPPQFGPLAVGRDRDKVVLALQGAGQGFSLVTLPVPGAASPHIARKWSAAVEGEEPVGAVEIGDELLMLFSGGHLRRGTLLRGPAEGEPPLGPVVERERLLGAPVAREGMLYIATSRSLRAVRIEGSLVRDIWNWTAPEGVPITTIAVVTGRLALVCTGDGRLHALLRE